MGPLIDFAAVARVDRIVEDSASYGKVIVRGGPVSDGPLAFGAFYRPSLIEVEDLDAPIIQQEIFRTGRHIRGLRRRERRHPSG